MLSPEKLIALTLPVVGAASFSRLQTILALSPFAYWPLDEAAGTAIADHSVNAYTATGSAGITYNHAGPGSGNKSIYLDGDEYIQLPAGFGSAFPGSCGPQASMCIWGKADSWVGTNNKAWQFLVSGAHQAYLSKDNTNDRTTGVYVANSVAKSVNEGAGQTSTDWRWYCLAWDINAGVDGELKFYVDNVQLGTTQTGLGVWAGALPSAGRVLGAADNIGSNGWLGYLSEAIMFDRVISPPEMATIFGV